MYRGQEVGFLRWWEVGEIGENCTTSCNVLQSKKRKEAVANKTRVRTGIKGYGKREVYTPSPPYQRVVLMGGHKAGFHCTLVCCQPIIYVIVNGHITVPGFTQ